MPNTLFHFLTSYPEPPLFRQTESEGRLLRRDWDRYDTAHCENRSTAQLEQRDEAGYNGVSPVVPLMGKGL